jgi:16S rRNA (adenine1518-N6/adenine1519-N6)-dimethyltransferase
MEPECRVAALERVTAAAFGQRRKMLRASLKTLVPDPEPLLAAAGLDPEQRARLEAAKDELRALYGRPTRRG